MPVRLWFQKSLFALLLAFTLGTTACQDETAAPVMQSTHQAYDLVGFLDQEADALSAQKALVTKTVSTADNPTETKTISTINWAEELAPFADADINKPALAGLFTEEVKTNPLGQQVRRYTAKEDADTNVQQVTYLFDAQGRLVQVDATIVQENMLFNTQKILHLEAQPSAAPTIRLYRLDETQKLMFMDAQRYGVLGEIAR
ncbi:hypothetical protein [Rufibacter sp. XAAS-G3-1]|uniref:hypothetical protein n=1 Tax=Rufibacter sp. XAAS-G3-1 TaxID=2729134 RepID=UPI0015E766EC|nr:hypothetical protein [Rufibacter sp. XAAS-G3-1]